MIPLKDEHRNWVYDNWSKVGVLIALVYTGYFVLFPYGGGSTILAYKFWPFVAMIPAFLIHQFEEFTVFDFTSWLNRTVFKSDRDGFPVSRKSAFVGNVPVFWSLGIVAAVLVFLFDFIFFAVFVLVVMFVDGWFHVSYTVGEGRVSPGVVTSLLLYLPLPAYTVLRYYSTGELAGGELLAIFLASFAFTTAIIVAARRRMMGAIRASPGPAEI